MTEQAGKSWTDAELVSLVMAYNRGASLRVLAAMFGTTDRSISRALKKLRFSLEEG